ncbi:hypothetical protein ASPZODRAFT_132352 [Penicilliopsis zonata CBS 506.65]|uniref:RTA1 like protein n=1 Tax=Penicilliopsis zonata CBS 506.65 TaxID=1073090 RepID=A0A1L9SJU4_9EURO|nr:hypothetical protein ASPZODRAFT_132352 [Penicilliopsis zonata CBS 506.65]OJJ47356.1 hypothetical protein ASPZODRAFT_132352 [Penicilliopsis zonata CBS 506.65]
MTYVLYNYTPSAAAAIIFTIAFAISTALHFWQIFTKKTWYFIPFVIGGCFEVLGYIMRYMSAKQSPNYSTGTYAGQNLLLLLAPSFFAASVYMILGRIIRLLNAGSISLVRPNWLTKIFVTGDVLSFFIQSGGGGMMATASTTSAVNMGEKMIIGGLFVQVLSFGFFIIVSFVFHRRMLASPSHAVVKTEIPWTKYMMVLYAASLMIMVRSIYRVAEYIQGTTGFLQSHEVFIYIFDATLMLGCCILFNLFHPSKIISKDRLKGGDEVLLGDSSYARV